jgi:hypothetical protein
LQNKLDELLKEKLSIENLLMQQIKKLEKIIIEKDNNLKNKDNDLDELKNKFD